jgi:hypothetical protein
MATRAAARNGVRNIHAFPFEFGLSAVSIQEEKSKITHSITFDIKQMELSSEIECQKSKSGKRHYRECNSCNNFRSNRGLLTASMPGREAAKSIL